MDYGSGRICNGRRAPAQRAAFARGFTVSFFELDTSVPDTLVKRETISILSAFPLRTALRPEAVSRTPLTGWGARG
jgi:hypothetical protein